MANLSSDYLKKLLDMMENHFGKNNEIVLHDLTKDYNHTIIDIRNGHITGRSIGDCGSNLGLEVLRGTVVNGDRYNYITHTKDGKVLRSSSMYFYEGKKVKEYLFEAKKLIFKEGDQKIVIMTSKISDYDNEYIKYNEINMGFRNINKKIVLNEEFILEVCANS